MMVRGLCALAAAHSQGILRAAEAGASLTGIIADRRSEGKVVAWQRNRVDLSQVGQGQRHSQMLSG
jgi:hypothetical protein